MRPPLYRYGILLAALAMQVCLGATYSWSVFVRPIRELTGVTQGLAQLPFTVFYLAFPATMIVSGMLLPRIGPRASAITGGVLFGAGWLLASLGQEHFGYTVLGIGLIAGMGVACAYIVPIAVAVQWFPGREGAVTGIAVAGFGGGAALVGKLGAAMMEGSLGMTPFAVFARFGAAFALIVGGAGLVMRFAPDFQRKAMVSLSLAALMRRREFLMLYAAMVTGLAAGFAVNANLRELSAAVTLETGVAAVGMFALCNAAGRILYGGAADRLQPAGILAVNLCLQSAVLLAAPLLTRGPALLPVFAGLAGFNYGGVLVLYASTAARLWGSEHVGQVYGLLFSANIVAAPAPVIAGSLYDAAGSFIPAFIVFAALMLAAAGVIVRGRSLLDVRRAPAAVQLPAIPQR